MLCNIKFAHEFYIKYIVFRNHCIKFKIFSTMSTHPLLIHKFINITLSNFCINITKSKCTQCYKKKNRNCDIMEDLLVLHFKDSW